MYDILFFKEATATTATFGLNDGERPGTAKAISLYNQTQTTVLQTKETNSEGLVTFTGLTPETEYYAYYADAGYEKGTTLSDDAKVATESQWADLIDKIKALDARITALEGN